MHEGCSCDHETCVIQSWFQRSFHLVADDRDYRHFVKDRKRLVKTFWKAFEGYKYIEQIHKVHDPIKTFAFKVFRQRLYFQSVRFWRRLKKENWSEPLSSDERVSTVIWDTIGKQIISNIADTKHETNTKYEYSNIDDLKFYALWGIQFCCRQMKDKGQYYMTNIECVYNMNAMTLTVNWVVMHKTKKGTRSANRPLI
eukprot:837219_1